MGCWVPKPSARPEDYRGNRCSKGIGTDRWTHARSGSRPQRSLSLEGQRTTAHAPGDTPPCRPSPCCSWCGRLPCSPPLHRCPVAPCDPELFLPWDCSAHLTMTLLPVTMPPRQTGSDTFLTTSLRPDHLCLSPNPPPVTALGSPGLNACIYSVNHSKCQERVDMIEPQ